MKNLIISAMVLTTLLGGCKEHNPLLEAYNTPFNAPPFDKIKIEHYIPAFEKGIADARVEVDAITNNTDVATFENTIEALENQGKLLNSVATIFFTLNSANTNDQMDEIANKVQPMLTEFSNDVSLNEKLFERVKAVYAQKDSLNLDVEQSRLLENTYKSFSRNGAALSEADKKIYREVTNELASLSLKFQQNTLAATNAFALNIGPKDSALVAELPQYVVEAMAEEAAGRNEKGWTVTLQIPSYLPFLTYSSDRELKEKLWKAYGSKCMANDEKSNKEIVRRIAELRLKEANLFGYNNYADFVLEERMAEKTQNVTEFLQQLLDATKSYADNDFNTLKSYAMASANVPADFMPWDWAYYEEKYKNEKYSLNEEEIKPYLQLENVQNGVFMLAEKLYGLTFKDNGEIPKYHPDVKVYEVYDQNNKFMALLYMDFFPRESKRGGAWMTSFREMSIGADGTEQRPFVSICCNFTKPTKNQPSLLTFDEFSTLLHEFGHGLHGMLAEGRYESLTGTNVFRDFVELPSQIMENWATEKEFLDMFAVHYQTGEKMPEELVGKIIAAKNYLAAYSNVRQIAYAKNDMAWHTITEPVTDSVDMFERRATADTQMFPYVDGICNSTSFGHIFSGGYAAGYYSYKWAEVLEADAFSLFKEKGIFSREVAQSFRDNVLAKGGTENPMDMYVKFRGHKPDVKALLKKMGVEDKI